MDRTESCLPDDDGRGDDDEPVAGFYRTRVRNVLLAVVLAGSAVLGCSDFSGSSSEDFTSSRRLAITAVIASVLIIRTLRRVVIVSPTGLEARRTLWTWRVPWSVVESFAIGDKPDPSRRRGPMTVVLIDGSSRCARVGWGTRGQPTFPEVADAARRHQRLHQRGYLEPNGPLLAFLLGGVALITACAVSETGRMNQRLFSRRFGLLHRRRASRARVRDRHRRGDRVDPGSRARRHRDRRARLVTSPSRGRASRAMARKLAVPRRRPRPSLIAADGGSWSYAFLASPARGARSGTAARHSLAHRVPARRRVQDGWHLVGRDLLSARDLDGRHGLHVLARPWGGRVFRADPGSAGGCGL